jgi:hypothetical protein
MNTNVVNLRKWLAEHSVKSKENGAEIVFTHASGETSILLLRNEQAMSVVQVSLEPLASFYREYSGASIGNTQILIGTNVKGGVQLSPGLRLPDLEQMTKQARELEIAIGKSEQVFMAEAAWMFVYTIAGEGEQGVLRRYDRDFGTNRLIENLDGVFESWWKIVQADP